MNQKQSRLTQTFAQTTIPLREVQDYLHSDPGYLASAIECENNAFEQTEAHHAD